MQFIYMNDEKTDMFGMEHHQDGKTLEIPTDTPIRAVALRRSNIWCKGLKFFDEQENMLVEHTWMENGDMGQWTDPYKIPEGQRIVGFKAYKHSGCAIAIGFVLGTAPP